MKAGPSTSSVTLSKSTVHRWRKKQREITASEIKSSFLPTRSVVHWDGKLMPDGTDTSSLIDRLPVIVTKLDDGNAKLLGVPALQAGTGKATSKAVFDLLHSWGLTDHVIGMCYDTTAVNTGKQAGAATLLETLLDRDLLWLSCRHHMFEILLSDIYRLCFGPSCGAEVPMFKRFRQNWSELNHKNPSHDQPLIIASDELKSFVEIQILKSQSRDDYLELLQLTALAIGLDVQVIYFAHT